MYIHILLFLFADFDAQLLAEVDARATAVTSLLQKKNVAAAMAAALLNPPVLAKSDAIKEKNCETVMKVFSAMVEADATTVVAGLDADASEVLMKYTYKILGKSSDCATALRLQALLHEKIGPGSVMRVLTDRKTV